MIEVIRGNGAVGAPGIYTPGDPQAIDEDAKAGRYRIDFGKAWIKSPHISAGQALIMHYNRDLMMAILWDRMPYFGKVVNVEVIPLDRAPDAYRIFDQGAPKKFVIDPHNTTKLAA